MMKRLIALFACLLFSTPILAETYFRVKTDVLEVITQRYFSEYEQQESVLQKYRDYLNNNNGVGLQADEMWQVCNAGGLDITQQADKEKCVQFVNALVSFGDSLFFSVCKSKTGIDADKRDISKCEADFFNYTNVQQSSAVALSKLYAKEKYNDEIICSTEYRKAENDDFIQCKSLKTGAFYEFKFDDIRESFDDKIQGDIIKSVCGIYNSGASVTGGANKPGCLQTNAQTCSKIRTAFQSIIEGTEVDYKSETNKCEIGFRQFIKSEKDLKTACDIDSFVFCRDTQFNTQLEFIEALKEYTARKCGTDIFNIRCDSSFKTYTGSGCNVSTNAPKDDIVSCYIGNQQIDYVFDDVNELMKKRANAGMQAMTCILADGTFDGKNCAAVSRQGCEELIARAQVDCPDCKDIYWDDNSGLCVLPVAKSVTNTEKVIKIGGVVVAAAVAVTATLYSGGTAAPGAWAVVAKIGSGLVITGAAGKVASESVITFGIFEPFVKKANQCLIDGTSECAEKLLIDELNRMQSYSEEFGQAEAKALDDIFVKLINQLDDDSKFWTDFYGNSELFKCDANGNCVVKEKKQFWQYFRTISNGMMIAGGLLNIIGNTANSFVQARDAIEAKVVGNMNNKSNLLKYVSPDGSNGTLVSNKFIASLGRTAKTNSELVKELGLQLGQSVWFTKTGQIITDWTVAQSLGIGNLVAATVGTGGLVWHALEEDTDFLITRPNKSQAQLDLQPVVPSISEIPVQPIPIVTQPVSQQTVPTTPAPVVIPAPVVTPDPDPVVIPTPVPVVTPDPVVVPTPVVIPTPNGRTITSYDVTKPRTGLIAGAAVLGTVGTGFLVGGLLNRDKDHGATQQNVLTGSGIENEINTILNNAYGIIGIVDSTQIKLISMDTTANTKSPIVNINNKAVVVADYNGHNLPFYMDASTQSWTPLLGIGQTGGWFNLYLTNPIPAFITQIQALLNQKLAPTTILKFIGSNSYGVQIPYAAVGAYSVINAEFPDGVVQTYNGRLVGASKVLHDNNYNKIKNL
ncbi:MAG: hypothetical protein IJN91_03760 [Alphaproteobacteria bacterium]|nr:hypothetical protein [Alphaproteobacteria bacterium]